MGRHMCIHGYADEYPKMGFLNYMKETSTLVYFV
jgi:hypothetical protein